MKGVPFTAMARSSSSCGIRPGAGCSIDQAQVDLARPAVAATVLRHKQAASAGRVPHGGALVQPIEVTARPRPPIVRGAYGREFEHVRVADFGYLKNQRIKPRKTGVLS